MATKIMGFLIEKEDAFVVCQDSGASSKIMYL